MVVEPEHDGLSHQAKSRTRFFNGHDGMDNETRSMGTRMLRMPRLSARGLASVGDWDGLSG
jgi:hypothetical protein